VDIRPGCDVEMNGFQFLVLFIACVALYLYATAEARK
jgi:hypothetical protein